MKRLKPSRPVGERDAVRREALLEAAEYIEKATVYTIGDFAAEYVAFVLREMAGE